MHAIDTSGTLSQCYQFRWTFMYGYLFASTREYTLFLELFENHGTVLNFLNLWDDSRSAEYKCEISPRFGPVVPQECSDCDVKSMKARYPAFDRISAVLTTISEELPDVPLFVSLHNLCATLKCTSPSAVVFRSAVINAGYRISGTQVNPLGLKSDAPMNIIWDIMRCWVKKYPVKAQPPEHPGSVILAKEPMLQSESNL
ncbi:hypothetical protein E3N88_44486 [Mikania micrantha]|uniref:tRNA (guanine(26)-N(2))-dimethyltransferase n=1 Tax=Mikania micrantha TaxID=192012 RepID=A0A5N6LE85_9ASTR|nr:hypothetical protein E3N88_44486 [Mikania micrantha]